MKKNAPKGKKTFLNIDLKAAFFKYQAQTSPNPLGLEVEKARGCYIFDKKGKAYLDLIAGVSVNTLGHHHPNINQAIKEQLDKHTHVMVYGEFIQEKPVQLCALLAQNLPDSLSSVYLTNSGTEATEGALKLAKRYTGRSEIIAAKHAYHGNTQGAMSVCGTAAQHRAFRPLIPNVKFITFNDLSNLKKITSKTAAVILETIQGGAGFICPQNDYLKAVAKRCAAVGALLILDEIQSGVGRTGKLYAFAHYGVAPDILITGKGLGGGLPIGAFVSNPEKMDCLTFNPHLGHITTFGGHPLIAAAAKATLGTLLNGSLINEVYHKEALFRNLLQHPKIKAIRGRGLMLALILESPKAATDLILKAKESGVLLFWLLYEKCAIRITPPLTIDETAIRRGCEVILNILNGN